MYFENTDHCIVSLTSLESNSFVHYVLFETLYSKMDQVKFLQYNNVLTDHITSDFLKAVFHKFYVAHFWKLFSICTGPVMQVQVIINFTILLAEFAKTFQNTKLVCEFKLILDKTKNNFTRMRFTFRVFFSSKTLMWYSRFLTIWQIHFCE